MPIALNYTNGPQRWESVAATYDQGKPRIPASAHHF